MLKFSLKTISWRKEKDENVKFLTFFVDEFLQVEYSSHEARGTANVFFSFSIGVQTFVIVSSSK